MSWIFNSSCTAGVQLQIGKTGALQGLSCCSLTFVIGLFFWLTTCPCSSIFACWKTKKYNHVKLICNSRKIYHCQVVWCYCCFNMFKPETEITTLLNWTSHRWVHDSHGISSSLSHNTSFGTIWDYCSGAIVDMLFIPLSDLFFHC